MALYADTFADDPMGASLREWALQQLHYVLGDNGLGGRLRLATAARTARWRIHAVRTIAPPRARRVAVAAMTFATRRGLRALR